MTDLLKKMFYFGVGAAVLTKEKVEELVDELVKKGEINQQDKPNAIKELMSKVQEQEKVFTAKVKEMTQKAVKDMGLMTRAELEELRKRIEKLESAVPK